MVPKRRYVMLDLMRGIASFAVMIYHFNAYFQFQRVFASSYLAVDLFFCLSGFVLSHSFGDALRNGAMSPSRYVAARVVRLYPLYFFSLLTGASYYLVKIVLGTPDASSFGDWLTLLGLGMVFLPNPDWVREPAGIFPFEPTAWSLSLEMAVSIVFGLLLFRFGKRALAATGALLLAGLLVEGTRRGTIDLGSGWDGFGAGALRALGAFCVGAAIQRAVSRGGGEKRRGPSPCCSASSSRC